LDYAVNRYYSSSLSRFLTPDLFGGSEAGLNPQSWNRYSYSLNDPVNYFDPTGKNAVCVTKVDEGDDDSSTECFGGDGGDSGSGASDSGAGGTSQPIIVKKFTTSGKKAQTVQNDLRWLQQAIAQNSDCAKWLMGSTLAINYILDVPGSGATAITAGVGSFTSSINGFAGTAGTNLTPGSALITINLNGAFFNSGPSTSVGYGIPSWITGGSNAAQAEILLHELAHDLSAAGFLNDDANSTANQTTNNSLVLQNCGDVVKQAAGQI
jgi:uncharacterized protein RhaS with RHS repeats